jgi:hypothetical protein
MKSRIAVQHNKKVSATPARVWLQHAAVHPGADHVAQHEFASTLTESRFGQDFSGIAVQSPPSAAQSDTKQSCGLTPRTCPFGGACHTCPARVQTKLTINQPGDEYEQEADRAAEQVMQMKEPDSEKDDLVRSTLGERFIQRKCAECDDEDEMIQKKESPGETGAMQDDQSRVPPIVQEVLRSPGQPLDSATRAFFEPRFGHNFSRVRVHADDRAAQSARAMKAFAYTVGNDIVFGAGKFAVQKPEGRHLLAHELMHTLQQDSYAARTLRRAADGPFTIKGLYEDRAKEPDFVFFELAEPTKDEAPPESVLDANEQKKIHDKAKDFTAAKFTNVTLYGYASEEGSAAENRALIDRRLAAVKNVLVAKGYTGAIGPKPSLKSSVGQADYRFWRCVEIQAGKGAPSSRAGKRGVTEKACDAARTKPINDAREAATKLIKGPGGALEKLENYIKEPKSEKVVADALDHNIGGDHSKKNAEEVRKRIKSIQDFIDKLSRAGFVQCGTEDNPTCQAGAAAMANPSRVVLCASFFKDPKDVKIQDEILVHESAHASGYRARDRAYRWERVILLLNRSQALNNAESLTLFILEVNGKRPPKVGPQKADVIAGCDPTSKPGEVGPKEKKIHDAIAWAERWNLYAVFGVAQTYGDTGKEAEMAPYFTYRFGRADRPAMAGILDRYKQMQKILRAPVMVTCLSAADAICSGGANGSWTLPDQVQICPTYFKPDDMDYLIIKIYTELAKQMPGVSAAQARAYPALAKDYKEEYWGIK